MPTADTVTERITPGDRAGDVRSRPASPDAGAHKEGNASDIHSAKRHRRNILSLSGAQVFSWAIVLAWTFVVPRKLGPDGWGTLVSATAIGGVLGVLMGAGTRNYLVRVMVRDPGSRDQLTGTALVARLAALPIGAAGLALAIRVIAIPPSQVIVFVLVAMVCYLALIMEPYQAVFQAVSRMEFLAGGTFADKALQAVGSVVVVLLGFGVVVVAGWWLAATVFLLALHLFWSRTFVRPRLHTDGRQVRTMLVESFPYWAGVLFLTFYQWVDSAMLTFMTNEATVGWYGVATRLFGTLMFAATILSTAWLPRLIDAHRQGDAQLRSATRELAERLAIISFPIALGAAAVAGPLIRLLFGDAFAPATPVLAILAVCVIPLYINIVAQQHLVAAGRQMVWTKVMIGASIVNPLINLAAIRIAQQRFGNGAVGAAVALLATESLIAVVSVMAVQRRVIDRHALSRVARGGIATLVMTAAVLAVRPAGLVAEVAVGVITFAGAAVVLRVPTAGDVKELRRIVARVRRTRVEPERPVEDQIAT